MKKKLSNEDLLTKVDASLRKHFMFRKYNTFSDITIVEDFKILKSHTRLIGAQTFCVWVNSVGTKLFVDYYDYENDTMYKLTVKINN